VDLAAADGKLVGEDAFDQAGASVSGAGDVDADGGADFLVGAPHESAAGRWAGAAYLVLGSPGGEVALSAADAKLVGEGEDDHAGWSVAGAGDVDGDGRDDVLVGAFLQDAGAADAGVAYVVLGTPSGEEPLSTASARLVGEEASDFAGWSVAGAGDVDGDGLADLLVVVPARAVLVHTVVPSLGRSRVGRRVGIVAVHACRRAITVRVRGTRVVSAVVPAGVARVVRRLRVAVVPRVDGGGPPRVPAILGLLAGVRASGRSPQRSAGGHPGKAGARQNEARAHQTSFNRMRR
jgi:hypothetical protein